MQSKSTEQFSVLELVIIIWAYTSTSTVIYIGKVPRQLLIENAHHSSCSFESLLYF